MLYANIPVILFTAYSKSSYNSETIKSLNKMKKSKIFFDNYVDAVNFINKNWNNIDKWWEKKDVQASKDNFLKNFAIDNQNLFKDVQRLIKQIKN